jgi:thiamine biosynthesis lipoprotein ApbE
MALRQWPELQLDQNQKPQFVQLDEDDSPGVPRRPPMLQLFTFPFSAMASPCAVHLYGDDRAGVEAIAEAAITEVARIGQRYSRYRSDGVLAEINDMARRAGSIVVDDETAKLLDYAYACHQRSDGPVWHHVGNSTPNYCIGWSGIARRFRTHPAGLAPLASG